MPSLVGGEPPTLVNQVRARTAPLAAAISPHGRCHCQPGLSGRAPLANRGRWHRSWRTHSSMCRSPKRSWRAGRNGQFPGITGLPEDSVIVLETNPGFVAALLVGLNQEFNRELLWREFPTDQRGTPFARFWPTAGNDVDEIARWPLDSKLGSQVRGRRGRQHRPADPRRGATPVPGRTAGRRQGCGRQVARRPSPGYPPRRCRWTSPRCSSSSPGSRTPKRATKTGSSCCANRCGEPNSASTYGAQPTELKSWADLTWNDVTARPTVSCGSTPPPNTPARPAGRRIARWGSESADMARIAFQQPFQMAFRAKEWLP